uniref:Uncharacterized protein n=1 Tax=Lactuca sativa TaxID=4236 RepID=A0A9R1VXS0_LACSA|nr:hypothetical protein LSAT_V11C400199040 [Lactuca sativa]
MGDAKFKFTPFLEAVRMRLNSDILNNMIITTVKPKRTNFLAEESYITGQMEELSKTWFLDYEMLKVVKLKINLVGLTFPECCIN